MIYVRNVKKLFCITMTEPAVFHLKLHTEKTLGEMDWYHMLTNLAVFEGGCLKCHEMSRAFASYNYEETEAKIEHFINSGTAPVHCSTIASKGYRCPNIGSCRCQSPAGLPFSIAEDDKKQNKATQAKKPELPQFILGG